jgi:hypothetical protein
MLAAAVGPTNKVRNRKPSKEMHTVIGCMFAYPGRKSADLDAIVS